jgi:hypothetical protein
VNVIKSGFPTSSNTLFALSLSKKVFKVLCLDSNAAPVGSTPIVLEPFCSK